MKSFAVLLGAFTCAAPLFASAGDIGTLFSLSNPGALLEGVRLETTNKAREIRLSDGVALRLSTRSSAIFFSGHMVLDRGTLRAKNLGSYEIDAENLSITAATPQADALIRIRKDAIEVASLSGAVNVKEGGAMLARIAVGAKTSFTQSGASADPIPEQSGATSGAAPGPHGPADRKVFLWIIGVTAATALAIGLTAAAQGKSPF
jgi:hypothetical protein